MNQEIAPNIKFKTKLSDDDLPEAGTIKIRGFKMPSSKRVQDIIESDLNDLKATILQDSQMLKAMPGNLEPEVINKVLIPKIIQIKYPELNAAEIEEVRQHVVVDSVIKNGEIKQEGNKQFVRMAGKFVNIEDLHIDLIDSINPFQKAFEILSKSVTTRVLKLIQEAINATRIEMTEKEALLLAPKFNAVKQHAQRNPEINASDPLERRLAEFVLYMRDYARKKANHG